MSKPVSAAFLEHSERPDSPIRPIVVAQTIQKNADGSLQAAVRQKRDDWGLADGAAAGPPPSLTGFSLQDNGDVRLAESVVTVITTAGPPTAYYTDLDRRFPMDVGMLSWGGSEPAEYEIKRVKIWLNPRVNGALTRQVVKWKMELWDLIDVTGSGVTALTLGKLCDAVTVDVTNDAEGLVLFDFSGLNVVGRPRPKRFSPGSVIAQASLYPFPTTFIVVIGLDKDGNAASNCGMGYDGGNASVTSGGNTLTSRHFTRPLSLPDDFGGRVIDGGVSSGCPIMTIDSGSYANASISFTTNPLDLKGSPVGDVQLIGAAHVPTGCSVTYNVRNDADSGWVPYTDGQFMTADLGLTPTQTRKFKVDLATNGALNLTPTLTRIGMEALAETIFLRQTRVTGGNWAIDPQTMKGEIPEIEISFIRDGDKDYADAITELLANNHIGDINIRLYHGDDTLARKDWLWDDDFDIDGVHPRGPNVTLKCLSKLCRLRDLVPRFKAGSVYAPISDVLLAPVTNWTTSVGGTTNLYQQINEANFDDTNYIQSELDPINSHVEVKLAPWVDMPGRRHLVDYRYRKDATSGEQIDLTVQLRCGPSTIIVQQVHTNIDTDTALSFTPFTIQLTDAQIATIFDYTDLRLHFIANKPSGVGSRRAIVSWAEGRSGGKQDQVTYNGTLKSVFDGLVANELAIDARFRGAGVEDITSINQVAKTIFQASAANNKPLGKSELDAIAYIAGGGLSSSQGRIQFCDMFTPANVRAIFPSAEINLDEAGPGYEERMPQLFCTWKWNAGKGDFDRQEYVVHAGALLHLGQARLDPAKWFDVEMSKWLSSEGLDSNGVSLAGRIGVRQVQALGPGLMLWPFVSNYPKQWLMPGDVILLQTDKFVGRDPNVSRAIRGAQWTVAVIQSRDVTGRRFKAWVRNYSDMLGTSQTGDRNTLGPATPHITALKAFIDDGGNGSFVVTTNAAAAVRFGVSNSALPADGAVDVATVALNPVDSAGQYAPGNVQVVASGQTFYVKVFAYEKADGSGAKVSSTVQITKGTRKRGDPLDDGLYVLPAITPDGLTAADGVTDVNARPIKKFFQKANTADPDHLDSVPDGSTYKKVTAVNSSQQITQPSVGPDVVKQLADLGVNMAINGDIEQGVTSWRVSSASGGAHTMQKTSSSPIENTYSMLITIGNTGTTSRVQQCDRQTDIDDSTAGSPIYFPVQPLDELWATCKINIGLLAGTFLLRVEEYDSAKALIQRTTLCSKANGGSVSTFQIYGGAVMSATTRYVVLILEFPGSFTDNGGTFKVDAIGLYRIPAKQRSHVYRSAAKSITSGSETPIDWDTEAYDIGGMHDNVTSNTELIVQGSASGRGVIRLFAQIQWANGTTGYRRVRIRKNGATVLGEVTENGTNTVETTQQCMAVDNAPAAGDYYEVLVTQTQGAGLNVNNGQWVSYFTAKHEDG